MNTLGSCLEEENRPAVFTPKTSGFPVIISIYTNVFKTLSLNFKNDVFSVSRINTIVKKKIHSTCQHQLCCSFFPACLSHTL